jgi:hypothetical protein
VQLHGTVQSIVIMLTFPKAPATNLNLSFHSISLGSRSRILGKGRRPLLWLLCFFLFFVLLILYSYLLFFVDPTKPLPPKSSWLQTQRCARPLSAPHPRCAHTLDTRGSPAALLLALLYLFPPTGQPHAAPQYNPIDLYLEIIAYARW